MIAHGCSTSSMTEPPVIGHLVRLVLESDWFTPAPGEFDQMRCSFNIVMRDLQGRMYWLAGAVKESPRQYGYSTEKWAETSCKQINRTIEMDSMIWYMSV